MEDCIFRAQSSALRSVAEDTRYLEILNYTDASYNTCEEHPLPSDELLNFVRREGVFAPPRLSNGVEFVDGLRLILQNNAQHPETFEADTVSFPADLYEDILRGMKLPLLVAETTVTVAPFLWFRYYKEEDDPYLQIIFRKGDVTKQGKTRGFEMMLSYSFQRRETVGFAKGTPSSDIPACIRDLPACTTEIGHPLLLPTLLLSYYLSPKTEKNHRTSRQSLRNIEHALNGRNPPQNAQYVYERGALDLRRLNQDITKCYAKVLWQSAPIFRQIIGRLEAAANCFWDHLEPDERTVDRTRLHTRILERLEFHRAKLDGIENYASATMRRLELQRGAVQFVTAEIAQQDAKLNLKIAGEQKRLAHASTRDSRAMKGLSLLAATFLPGTFLASIFSMSFFNFQPDEQAISSQLWIYFALTAPLTGLVVFGWLWWERARQQRLAREQAQLEESIGNMERAVMGRAKRL